ncbi:MAG: DegT/DnrJ/EryC1/StrS aminotransferase family protein, partial [Armatimonadota bacterium]
MMSELALHGGKPVRTEGPTASWPVVGDLEIQRLTDVIDSGDLLYGRGEQGVKFEQELAEWMGAEYAIGTINGTETMALALKAAGIGPGDEVIMPAMTFIACPQSVLLANAIPVLVDLTAHNVALDPELVEAAITDNTKAIMAVDLYGVAADMDTIMDIADRHDLFLLEDCAQAQGTEWRGKKLGTLGDAGSLSFHTAKCITSGDGGAVVTDSKELRDLMQSYRQFGQPFAGAEHD